MSAYLSPLLGAVLAPPGLAWCSCSRFHVIWCLEALLVLIWNGLWFVCVFPLDFSVHTVGSILFCLADHQFRSVQSLSRVRLFASPWIAAHQASLSITNSQSLLKLMSTESVMPSSHLILCRPLLLLPPIPPSIRVFSSESTLCMRWPKYWSFSFSISPSSEHPGLISFRMDWLDLLAVQGTLKSLLQHHSSKASILRRSAFFTDHHCLPFSSAMIRYSVNNIK